MDEVSQLISHSEHKIDALQRLRVHCQNLAKHHTQAIESHADGPVATKVLTDRVDWAIQLIKEDHRKLPGLLAELKGSLDVVSSKDSCLTISFDTNHLFKSFSNYARLSRTSLHSSPNRTIKPFSSSPS